MARLVPVMSIHESVIPVTTALSWASAQEQVIKKGYLFKQVI
jgi:hypothetical protein